MNNDNDKAIFHNQENSVNRRRKLLLGAGAAGVIATWQRPIVNAIIIPAHAQMSVCPAITIGNVTGGPLSGATSATACSLTFDVLSGTPGTNLNITAITPETLPADTTFSVDAVGTATNTVGPRIVWRGPAVGAPFACTGGFTVVSDLSFTVTATCDAAGGGTFTQDFTISDLIPPAP